jgi:hypothetical protein
LVKYVLNSVQDLQTRRYNLQKLDDEEPNTIDFSEPVLDDAHFKPAVCAAAVSVNLRVS